MAYLGEVVKFVRLHARLRRVAEGAIRAWLAAHLDRAMAAQGLQSLVAPGLGGRPALSCGCRGAAQDDRDVLRLIVRRSLVASAHEPLWCACSSGKGRQIKAHHVLIVEIVDSQIRRGDNRHFGEVGGSFAEMLGEGRFIVMI